MPQVERKIISWPSAKAFTLDVVRGLLALGLSLESSRLLCSHMALSTGWGRAADNYRFAGLKCTEEQAKHYDYTVATGKEYLNGKWVSGPMKWRAFNSQQEGLSAVLKLLRMPRYKVSYAFLTAGDEEYFSQLRRDGWYTAPLAQTVREMKSILYKVRVYTKDFEAPASILLVAAGVLARVLL